MSADAGSRAPARRRPLNVRVAVLLALALALLAASFRLSSTSLGSCGGAGATATATRAAATTLAATSSSSSSGSGSLQPQPYEGDPPDCEPPQLDRGALLEYGCQIDELACFDQVQACPPACLAARVLAGCRLVLSIQIQHVTGKRDACGGLLLVCPPQKTFR